MLLSISNIGWKEAQDQAVYAMMLACGFSGLEIAPTRIFPQKPYENLSSARNWAEELKAEYGFVIPSMQSIWFGKQEKIFGSETERRELLAYTKKAIDFASAIGCGNLVFGCPRNRVMPEGADETIAVDFFKELGEYAAEKGTVIGMEANPPIYNTNYVNDTLAAVDLIRRVDSRGFKLNLDIGTMIHNGEAVADLQGCAELINHVHISEPGLKPIERRQLHKDLADLLRENGYRGFVSIEMGTQEDLADIQSTLEYIATLFHQN